MTYTPPPGYQVTPIEPRTPWYHTGLVMALGLLFCWPIGLVLIWSSHKTSRGAKIAATIFIAITVGFGLIFMIVALVGASKSSGEVPVQARSNVTQPRANVTETCAELSKLFGSSSKLSDLQKEELWKQYSGRPFSWELQIAEVSSGVFSGFSVQAKCAVDSPSLMQDIQLSYTAEQKSKVLGMQKGASYRLSGTLESSSSLLGMSAKGD